MAPKKPLPYADCFSSADDYISSLLSFVSSSETFQIMCGGVHIVDFFTIGPGQFHAALPSDWHSFLLSCDTMRFVDFLARDDLENLPSYGDVLPPESLLQYVKSVRDLSLRRVYIPPKSEMPKLPRSVTLGMNKKKVHEVANFASYVDELSKEITNITGNRISHFVDFGSGQNYLGRALASEPFNRHVVAVEGREHNVTAARVLDVNSGLALKPKVKRNKKLWLKIQELQANNKDDPEALARAIKEVCGDDEVYEFRPLEKLNIEHEAEKGKGFVQYVSGRLDSGDLSDVIANIDRSSLSEERKEELSLMAVSIHSCGNLSHYGIKSLLLNHDIRAVAIVGCCYNLLTEKLGPPTYKHPYLRPTLQAANHRVTRESERHDPQGFPMSERFSTYEEHGIRLNVTARMMACQALENWSETDSQGFFKRHFYRAVLQKIFLDRGVVSLIRHRESDFRDAPSHRSLFDMSTQPVAIGTLKKSCYSSFHSYVRGAVEKLIDMEEDKSYAKVMEEKMGSITDDEIKQYLKEFSLRSKELSVVWSLMAFSAIVVESLIVSDRWTFLKENKDTVDRVWVETVFDYKQSPRNLVVVGVKG